MYVMILLDAESSSYLSNQIINEIFE